MSILNFFHQAPAAKRMFCSIEYKDSGATKTHEMLVGEVFETEDECRKYQCFVSRNLKSELPCS